MTDMHDDPLWLADRLEEDREYHGAETIRRLLCRAKKAEADFALMSSAAEAYRIRAERAQLVLDLIRNSLEASREEASRLRAEAKEKGGERTKEGRWRLGCALGREAVCRSVARHLPLEWGKR